jgi:hypothetical protein
MSGSILPVVACRVQSYASSISYTSACTKREYVVSAVITPLI